LPWVGHPPPMAGVLRPSWEVCCLGSFMRTPSSIRRPAVLSACALFDCLVGGRPSGDADQLAGLPFHRVDRKSTSVLLGPVLKEQIAALRCRPHQDWLSTIVQHLSPWPAALAALPWA